MGIAILFQLFGDEQNNIFWEFAAFKVDDDYEFCKFVHKNKFCDFVWKKDEWNITEADCNDFEGRMLWSGNYNDHLCAITITGMLWVFQPI